jgi:tetratricopeptide (TPR) repeat protein
MDEHEVEHVNLAYFGQADPAYYQIDFTALPSSGFSEMDYFSPPKLPGYVAISATTLTGVHLPPDLRLLFAPFRTREPETVVANSIRIYRVDEWPLADDPSDAAGGHPRRRLADAMLHASNWPAGAVPQYEKYLRFNRPDADVLVGYGAALLQVDRVADGITTLRRAIALDPGSGAAHLVLARALFIDRDLQGARKHAEAALGLRPRDPDASYLMARVRLVEGDRISALRFLQQTLDLDPAYAAARELMAAMAVTPSYLPAQQARAPVGP